MGPFMLEPLAGADSCTRVKLRVKMPHAGLAAEIFNTLTTRAATNIEGRGQCPLPAGITQAPGSSGMRHGGIPGPGLKSCVRLASG
eukprot:scaffold25882_cov25-Tisochrysis_lutea.AAC.3